MQTKILMVCLGNICRSPLAEGILRAKLPANRFEIDSAGTGDWHVGQAPDQRAIAVAKKHGIDISQQRARQIQAADLESFDYILTMDSSNLENAKNLAANVDLQNKIQLILSHQNGRFSDVPDPYFGGDDGFETVFQMLDQVCDQLADHLLRKHI